MESEALTVLANLDPNADYTEYAKWSVILNERTSFKHDILDAPKADVEEIRRGRWITWAYPGDEHVECSECHTQYYENDLYLGGNEFPKRCPECGARMQESKEE